jgi:hypothetical protein
MVAVFTYLNKKEKELEKVASKKLNEE